MNLVWLDISSSFSHSSLALPAIEATRSGDCYNWSTVRGTIKSDIFLLSKELYEARPTIIATTLWLFNHQITLEVCQRVKALLPEVVIIMGGPEFNGDNEPFLRRNPFVDFVFRGEGEEEFHRLLKGVDPAQITGLCYLDTQGQYVDNGTAKVADFAQLPAPEKSQFFSYDSSFVQLEFSRGCFNTCAFCVSGGDKPIRSKEISEIKQRIENIRAHGIQDIRVLDRTFNYSPARAAQMLETFRGFPSMNFHLEIHPALLTDSLCALLESMPQGLLHLEAGIQSLDDRVIEACGRIGTNEAAKQGLTRLCNMSNFETHADLIAGLPHYTLGQIYSDVRELSLIGAGEIQLELLKLLPGTKMRREAKVLGIKHAQNAPYEVLETPAISISELNEARILSKLIDKYYNAKPWQQVTRTAINESPQFLHELLSHLAPTELLDKPLSVEKRGEILYNYFEQKHDHRNCDSLSIAWISNGLSLRKHAAGAVTKANTLPESITRDDDTHYYLWQGKTRCCIFGFDRRREHSHPTLVVEL